VIVGGLEREAHGGRQRGLELARLARAQALDGQPQRAAQLELALELARVILVAGRHQRSRRHQPDGHAGALFQLTGERGPHGRRAQPQLQHAPPALAELDLGDRGEHPGCHARGAPPDAVALEHAPGDRQADDAAADDHHVHSVVLGHCR
jgi:hypothetical protein